MTIAIASGLTVVDLSVGLASAVVVRQLAEAGAEVLRFVANGDDPFDAVYPAYGPLKSAATLADMASLDATLARADVCLLGGEDFPGFARPSVSATELEQRYPGLVIVTLGGMINGEGRAVEILIQACSGLVFEQLPDRPVRFAIALATYGQALSAMLGLWAALVERNRSGKGQVVTTSMEQGLALFWSQIWMEADGADALFDKLPPRGVQHLIFRCADGDYLHFVLGVPGALAKLYSVLAIDQQVDPNERGIPTLARGPQSYFADRAVIEPAIATWNRSDLIKALNEAGLAAEPVLRPGEAWDDDQVVATGLIRTLDDGSRIFAHPFRFTAKGGERTERLEWAELPGRTGPLADMRVVDLGNFIAGPFASKLLADLGADVIRVEPPGSLAALTGIRNTWSSNRGKRSVVVDMKQADGLALVHRLCASADLVTHNFRLGVAARLSVDPASLRKVRSDIVTLETTGYGSVGPRAAQAGWDMVMQALCGHEARAGGLGNPPMWYRSALVDFATGSLGAIGALMGVYARDRGLGSIAVENSLLATALFLMSELVETPLGERVGAPVLDHDRLGFDPFERLYATADGWIAVAARGADMRGRFERSFGLEEASGAAEEVARTFEAALAGLSSRAALDILRENEVWAEACAPDAWASLRCSAAARSASLVIEADDQSYGRITAAFGTFVGFSRTAIAGPFRSTPTTDSDSAAIRAGLEPGVTAG